MNWVLGLVIILTSPFWMFLGIVLIVFILQMLIVLIAIVGQIILSIIGLFTRNKK